MFFTSEGEDIEGEYTKPIPSPNLTTNPDSNPEIEVRSSSVVEAKLSQETTRNLPTGPTSTNQSSSPRHHQKRMPLVTKSEHSGAKSGNTLRLDLFFPKSPAF